MSVANMRDSDTSVVVIQK